MYIKKIRDINDDSEVFMVDVENKNLSSQVSDGSGNNQPACSDESIRASFKERLGNMGLFRQSSGHLLDDESFVPRGRKDSIPSDSPLSALSSASQSSFSNQVPVITGGQNVLEKYFSLWKAKAFDKLSDMEEIGLARQ